MRKLIVFLFCLASVSSFSQTIIDSLHNEYKNAGSDTLRCSILFEICDHEPNSKLIEGHLKKAKSIIESNLKKFSSKHQLHKVFKKFMAMYFSQKGMISLNQGDLPKALDYMHQSMKIDEQQNNLSGVAGTLSDISLAYHQMGEKNRSLEYSEKSLGIYKRLKDQEGIARTYSNLGSIYLEYDDIEKALEYFNYALDEQQKVGDHYGVAVTLNNLSVAYRRKNQNEKSIEYSLMAIEKMEEMDDKAGVAVMLNNVGEVYYHMGKMQKAVEYSEKSLEVAKKSGYVQNIEEAAESLYLLYEEQGKYAKALEMHELFIAMRDSIYNENVRKAGIEKDLQYKYERKALADSVKSADEKRIQKAELNQQKAENIARRNQQYALYGGLVLVLIFAGFIYNRFRITQQQKKIIERQKSEVEVQKELIENQKHLVEEKQKEIIDSINYAQRLQNAILAREDEIKSFLPDSFLLYQPKDIVAGDFYFFEVTPQYIYYAAADCTGHGVPGAMVSVVCSNALSRCVKEFSLVKPGEILDKARELVIETFRKSGQNVKDGMDISLMSIERNTGKIYWSGANNPLWYFDGTAMQEITADKQPIGAAEIMKPFTTHEINVSKNAWFFLFTDGYADQFGGPKGKKFKYKALQELMLSHVHESPAKIQSVLFNAFEAGRGELEQVDDVCVIGIRV